MLRYGKKSFKVSIYLQDVLTSDYPKSYIWNAKERFCVASEDLSDVISIPDSVSTYDLPATMAEAAARVSNFAVEILAQTLR